MAVGVALGFAGDAPAWTAGADSSVAFGEVARQWVTTLHNKVGDNAMKFYPIVETLVGEFLEVFNGFGSLGGV